MPTEQDHSYLQNTQDATPTLHTFVKHIIKNQGSITFADFMQHALYHPTLGYYTRGAHKVGKEGDFFTSVSVGKTFGIILAHRIHTYWKGCDSPSTFHIVEMGANTGQLAKDILDTIQADFPPLYQALQYHISEHLAEMRSIQTQTLSNHQPKFHHHEGLDTITLPQDAVGITLSNELIDAFPVHIIRKEQGVWKEKRVSIDDESPDSFARALENPTSPELLAFTTSLSSDELPDEYETEFRPGLSQYTEQLKSLFSKGLIITIDYGHTHSSFYHPTRTTGTLRCYHQHKADENPLVLIGEKDITAHVDFTQLATHLRNSGFHITDFQSQSYYFTTHGKNWLLDLEKNPTPEFPKFIRQFQTLTHPTTMGSQFLILEAQTHAPESNDTLQKLEL